MIALPTPEITWLDLPGHVRVGRRDAEVIVEWPDFLRLSATTDMSTARLEPLAELDELLIAKAREGFARALPHYLRGAVVLHAAAVSLNGRGLLILGDSGAGKSTAAAVLCDHGAAFLADDTSVVLLENDELWLQPSETTHWLDCASRAALSRDASFDGKRPVTPTSASAPVKLAAAVVLEAHDASRVERAPLHGAAAAGALLRSALRLPLDAERSKHDLDALARIARRVPVHRVLRPRRFSSTLSELPALLDLLRA